MRGTWMARAHAYVREREFARVHVRTYLRACDRAWGRTCVCVDVSMCRHFDFLIWTNDVILNYLSHSIISYLDK